jgi:hypothetical protein
MARGFKSGGKQKGTKNKATLERERQALEILQGKALAPLRTLAKDQLAELVPVVKGIVARFQIAAMNGGAPGEQGYKPEFWKELRDWIKTYAAVADLAADFESPRFRAIAVMEGTGGVGKAPYVVRVPSVMADSTAWQAAVGSAVLDMEPVQTATGGRTEALPHPAIPQPVAPEPLPVPAPVALVADQKTGRITMMPPGPKVVQPEGTEAWLQAVTAERRKVAG